MGSRAPGYNRRIDRRTRTRDLVTVICLLAALFGAAAYAFLTRVSNRAAPAGRTCAYGGDTRSGLRAFDALVGIHVDCALVFDDAAPNWKAWDDPWFTNNPIANENWSSFAADAHNRLIITVNLFPTPLAASDPDWRAIGAAGGYTHYARILARTLVHDGMGDAVIRLAHEANGTWYPDNIGSTPAQWRQWREFWRRTVIAMRSVAGADFDFNWCIAAGYRAIPFADYYPGDDVVDSIGVDVYDVHIPSSAGDRWSYAYHMAGGVGAIAAFARRHHKPLTIPEWGLIPRAGGGGGDDPQFVRGLSRFVERDHVAFQSYFFGETSATAIEHAPNSVSAYRSAFAAGAGPAG